MGRYAPGEPHLYVLFTVQTLHRIPVWFFLMYTWYSGTRPFHGMQHCHTVFVLITAMCGFAGMGQNRWQRRTTCEQSVRRRAYDSYFVHEVAREASFITGTRLERLQTHQHRIHAHAYLVMGMRNFIVTIAAGVLDTVCVKLVI